MDGKSTTGIMTGAQIIKHFELSTDGLNINMGLTVSSIATKWQNWKDMIIFKWHIIFYSTY